ncbi:MAG: 30S ribosome-binding factor RbfA [Candidatus Cloacimonetes bacterium]|nr:30S ribosome-binding factor RbfA [Candidatus Cloacimonadota bacterium]
MARIRIKRLESELLKLISNIINYKLRDNNLTMVTVTGVKLTNDLSYLKIFFSHFDETNTEDVLNSLNKSSGFIKNEIAKAKFMRKIPQLIFEYDKLEEEARDLDKIFAKINAEKKENDH